MEKYQEYKDSGVLWLGKIPDAWKALPLKYCIRGYKSGPFGSALLLDKLDNNGTIAVYSPEHIVNSDAETYYLPVERKAEMSQFELQVGDIYFPIVGTLGRAKVFEANMTKGIINQRLAKITPDTMRLDESFFLLNMCECNHFKQQLSFYSRGAILEHITKEILLQTVIPVPSIEDQRSIVTYLDHKTAQIDSVIANKEKLIELLKEKRQAIISETVTHGLDTFVPMKDSGIDWIGQIPAHWEVKPLFIVALENRAKNDGNQCDNLLSLSYGKIINKDIETNFGLLPESFETYQIVQGGYTILRLTDLQNDKRSLRTGFVKEMGIITSAYVGLIPTLELDGRFLSDLLHAYDIMKIFYSLGNGVRQSMNYKDLKRLPILVPPIAEQQKISATLLQETAKLDALVSEIESQIMALKEYRQSIISEAVTGKIKVADSEMAATAEQPRAKTSGANVHFKRRVLAAKILDKLCGENTLGHVKLEKLLFLSEYCAELDMHTEYVRHAAGPYSPKVLRSIDTQLQKAKWFVYDKNNHGSKYCRLDKSTEYAPYFDANFSAEQNTTVEHLVELFRTVDTERCEIVATLYGAWNDFLIDGCTPTDEQIADEVLTHWSEEKKRIDKDRWIRAIGWMRKHKIVPCGYGEKTKRRDI